MALTPKQVVNELAETGRRVTERQLIDWRRRELLPALSEKGQGQGKGKIYFWTRPDILDRVAFVADHKGWDTSRIILVLWCCGFEVPQTTLKEAWLEEIEKVTRLVTKQNMNAQWRLKAQDYFDDLDEAFHQHAAAFKNLKAAEGDDIAKFAYETVQVICAFIFANAVQDDIKIEIDHINQYLPTYKPQLGDYPEFGFPTINVEAALSMRRFVNVFEMRDAIRDATRAQFDEAQFIWRTVCRAFILMSDASSSPQIGLTEGRIAQVTFGRLALSALMVALQTKAERPLVRLNEAIAELMDWLEAGRKAGKWHKTTDLGRFFSEEIDPEFKRKFASLWSALAAAIQA
jgi:hypothetical protein